MAYSAGLEASLRVALEEALQTPQVQAALTQAGVEVSDVSQVTVTHSSLGTTTVAVTPPE